ncbi:MAG: prenyltransferase, partial [Gammaproteobacteria bacterium]|nr:prenyltransferase [Gammaproteobacteria bacterium]
MKEIAGIIRLPFLLLAPACVFLAAGLASSATGELDWGLLSLIMLASVSAAVAVNALNEYQDFHSGLDLHTERTPFSGGSGTLPENPHLAPLALKISIIAIALTVMSGLVLIYQQGMELILPGLIGLLLIILYTKVINRYPVLCLLSPGLGFGILMVGGSYFALTGSYTKEVFLVSLIPFFLVNNLLLLNQFPDVSA